MIKKGNTGGPGCESKVINPLLLVLAFLPAIINPRFPETSRSSYRRERGGQHAGSYERSGGFRGVKVLFWSGILVQENDPGI